MYVQTYTWRESEVNMGEYVKRFSLAMKPENYEWLQNKAIELNMSITEFINSLIEIERKRVTTKKR